MMPQPLDNSSSFQSHGLPELRNHGRIVSAAKSKVLPDEQTQLIANVIEAIMLGNPTGPNTDQLAQPVTQKEKKNTLTES
jgi:hypothetical protein